jgi:hypothetical protein
VRPPALLRFTVEATLLVAVGVALAVADLELLPFVVVMAVAWVIVAAAERILSRPRAAPSALTRRVSEEKEAPAPIQQSVAAGREPRRPESAPHRPRAREREPRRLEAVPEPEPEPDEEEVVQPVAELPQAAHRRPDGWNLWDLELRAKQVAGGDPLRDEEWSALLVSLREFARPDGTLPSDFDSLVREAFAELIRRPA